MNTKYEFKNNDEQVDDYNKEIEETSDVVQKKQFTINQLNQEILSTEEEIKSLNNRLNGLKNTRDSAIEALKIK